MRIIILSLSLFFMLLQANLFAQENIKEPLKLYLLDCGVLNALDMAYFSSTGEYDGVSAIMAASCFLIRHEKGDFLWDFGLEDSLVTSGPMDMGTFVLSMEKTMIQQLEEINLGPKDIEYISISHSHFDHTGQISAFGGSEWLVNENELNAMKKDGEFTKEFTHFKSIKPKVFTGDYDVFGDGSVMILETPGHTPGHTVLQVTLAKTGTILLSGDLYHQAKSRKLKLVPTFNFDEDQTRKSFERFENIATELNAKVILQHEKSQIEKLPKLPDFLQ